LPTNAGPQEPILATLATLLVPLTNSPGFFVSGPFRFTRSCSEQWAKQRIPGARRLRKPASCLLTCLIGLAVPMLGLAPPTITVQPQNQTNIASVTGVSKHSCARHREADNLHKWRLNLRKSRARFAAIPAAGRRD